MAILRLRPIATTRNDLFTWFGAETPHEAVDEDPFDVADGLTSYLQRAASATSTVLFKFEPPPLFSSITSINLVYEARAEAAASAGYNGHVLSAGSTASDSVQTPTSFTERSWSVPNDPATAAAWTYDGLVRAEWGFQAQGEAAPIIAKTLTRIYLLLDIVVAPVKIAQTRAIASALLSALHRPSKPLVLDVPPRVLDLQTLNVMDISHFAGPDAGGLGWGVGANRRSFLYMGGELNLRDFRSTAYLWDPKHYVASMWYSFLGAREASSTQDGIAKLLNGGTEKFIRDGDGWCVDPSSNRIALRREDEPLDDIDGRLMGDATTSRLLNNMFSLGTTSWASGGGGNGATNDVETDPDLLGAEPAVSGNTLRLHAGSPLGGINRNQSTSASFGASAKCFIAIRHWDLDGVAMRVGIRNNTTNNFLQSNGTWGADTNISLTVRSSGYFTDIIEFTNDTSAGTIFVRLVAETTANQDNLVQAVMLDDKEYFRGWVRAEGSAVTKNADEHELSAVTGALPFPLAEGTFFHHFKTLWANAGTGTRQLWIQIYDGNNSHQVFWLPASSRFTFRIRAGATNYDADISSLTIARGDEVRLVGRYTAGGRLDLAALRHDLWVSINAGAWQTSGPVAHVTPTASSPDVAYLGSIGSTSNLSNVYWLRAKAAPVVLSQSELQRMPLL